MLEKTKDILYVAVTWHEDGYFVASTATKNGSGFATDELTYDELKQRARLAAQALFESVKVRKRSGLSENPNIVLHYTSLLVAGDPESDLSEVVVHAEREGDHYLAQTSQMLDTNVVSETVEKLERSVRDVLQNSSWSNRTSTFELEEDIGTLYENRQLEFDSEEEEELEED